MAVQPTALQVGLMSGFALQDGDKLAELINEASSGGLPLTGGTLTGPLQTATVGFNGTAPIAKPSVTGSLSGGEALVSLIDALTAYGLIVNNTTA
jgi:hypothetical protein